MDAVQNKSIGLVKPQKIFFDTVLPLLNGQPLNGFELMIETYGTLNKAKNNAILICPALAGTEHVAGIHHESDKHTGWWDNMVGPGKPIDTNHFFVVGLNNLGGCNGSTGPLSIDPRTNKPFGSDFPIVTVTDWVRAQSILADKLGIDVWAAVIGGSLGGMQALQWTIEFPERVRHALVIASSPKLSTQNIAFNDVARQAIMTDPDFCDGHFYEQNKAPKRGLRIARMMGHITYLSEDGLGTKFGRELKNEDYQFGFDVDFEVESYLRYQGDKFSDYFDANTYLLMTKALDYFDPAKNFDNDLTQALQNAQARFLIISFTSDWRFSPERSKEIVKALICAKKNVQYVEVESIHGHDAFLMTDPIYIQTMRTYLQKVAQECQ
ncbi:homoserine O-succinyltransferase MetX [Neisseria sp. Ec49-e6-T10]|uniref:homoserine O-succinyltransferase MetX n=1 Tax=Neisseria sp. Ec49-e6-T10 TaxID=3140744 RepID=UPI003EBB5E6F